MRKADRIIRDRHSRIPDKYKKIDTAVNGDVESLAKQHKGYQWMYLSDYETLINKSKNSLPNG